MGRQAWDSSHWLSICLSLLSGNRVGVWSPHLVHCQLLVSGIQIHVSGGRGP